MRTSTLIALLLATSPAWAQVYKWVDEQGRTHYGEKPPANKGAPVNLRDPTGGPRPEANDQPAFDGMGRQETELQRQEREFQYRQQQRELRSAEERQRQAGGSSSSDNVANCRRARNDVLIMDRFSTSYTFAQRSEAQSRVSRYCR